MAPTYSEGSNCINEERAIDFANEIPIQYVEKKNISSDHRENRTEFDELLVFGSHSQSILRCVC